MALRQWTVVLAAAVTLCLVKCGGLKAPSQIRCVFVHRVNITCQWEPGDNQTTHYTLNVQRISYYRKGWNCSTMNTSCTVKINKSVSANFNFCVNVTAHSRHGNITSQQRCQLGINEVKLHPVKLDYATSVSDKPHCMTLRWHQEPALFLISAEEIKEGMLESQIEFYSADRALEQPFKHMRNMTVRGKEFEACIFSPDTRYSLKLRHRYRGGTGPWSGWSNEVSGKTTEAAPSSAPMFWRQVIHQDKYRRTSLMWKHLPHTLANGKILFYNVTCQDENAEVLEDQGNCSSLNESYTSCVLTLPLEPCSCSISASTSVGPSPNASIWLRGAEEKELPAPLLRSITAVNGTSFEVKWTHPPAASSLSGFVVEWFVVPRKNSALLHWEHVNEAKTAVVITEGVKPFQRYAVSVIALYGKEGTGPSKTEFAYTRQKAPSAGPKLDVVVSGRKVTLSWSLAVEKMNGFIRNYTLFYGTSDEAPKEQVLPGSFERYSLTLAPGHYEFRMLASTEGGAGEKGPPSSADIGPEEFSVVLYILLSISLISLLLIVTVCVSQSKIVKEKLCQEVPDPSLSTLAKWSPETQTRVNFTKAHTTYSEIVLLSDRATVSHDLELELDQDKEFHIFPYSTAPTHYKHDRKSHSGSRTTNMADANFTSCPVIYSTLLLNSEPTAAAAAASSELQHHSYPDVRLHKQPQEGDRELLHSYTKAALDPLKQMQRSCVACPSSLLQPDVFSQADPMQQNTFFPCVTFPDSLFINFMDSSQNSRQCDPYLPV